MPLCVLSDIEAGNVSNLVDRNLSSTGLESGNALGAFLQTPDPVLDNISGPSARFLSRNGLGFGTPIGRAQFFPAPALDEKSVSKNSQEEIHPKNPPKIKKFMRTSFSEQFQLSL